jgi:acyl transferase domain-containing protein/phosphopantetheinyl transferase
VERDVAIIGMACVFPKAPNLEAFWLNVRDGVDAITDVPPARWDPLFYDPASTAPDRFYARRGGFIDEYAKFDAAAFGIMPVAAQGAEPDQLLALDVAVAAIADAGYADRPFARDKTSIILGRGNYIGPAMLRLINITRGAQQIVDTLRTLLPDITPEQLQAVKAQFQAKCGVYGPDTAIGLVPNLVASRIANRLDLGGTAYTIDAACASTLVAVDQACRQLREGESDVVIAGGVHLCHDPVFWSVFSQLGALSRSQQIRPFDRRADGLLIGEGIGMLVMKRLADAQAGDDRIYAVIRGTGVASDGRDVSLMTPRVEGQVLAVERAWKAAGLDPSTVGLVEAHGTATQAGDSAELATLARVFGPQHNGHDRVAIGSVKSMIGHAMPAAGAAGLIKAALAVYHGVRPPTLHCEEPNEALSATRFRPLREAEPWDEAPRRAAVNAFGFGGINSHVILDAPHAAPRRARARAGDTGAKALVCAGPSQAALLDAIDHGNAGGEGPWRVAVFDPTPKRMAVARAAVAAGRARHGRDGIYFAPGGLVAAGGKVAFLYPGVEADFAPHVDDVAAHFGLPAPDVQAPDLEHAGLAIVTLDHFLTRVLDELGVRPDAIAGHSIGEWAGMLAAGIVGSTVEEFASGLRPGTLEVADVAYVAAGAGAQRLAPLITDLPGVFVSHDNCDHQSILCGPHAAVEPLSARLRAERVLFEVLPFRSGFHSPALARQVDYYMGHLARVELRKASIPLWSATTCAPYPDDAGAIRALFRDHLLKPVRFRELIRRLYDEAGARVFVQVGTGSLVAFVDDVLVGRPHQAVSLVSAYHPGMEQVRRACAALFVEGARVDLARVGLGADGTHVRARHPMSLELSAPLVRIDLPPLSASAPAPRPAKGHDHAPPLLAAFEANLRELASAQDAVRDAFARKSATTTAAVPAQERSDEILFSAEKYPELWHHGLIPQPAGWPVLADWAPAVPMTMSIALMIEAAQRLEAGRVAVSVEDVRAMKWLRCEPAVTATVTAKRAGADRVAVEIGDYIACTVVLADRYPEAPPPNVEPIVETVPFPIARDAVYRDNWLFHGPSYQGVVSFGEYGSNGLRGTLQIPAGKGAMFDNAGQLVGLWAMLRTTSDRLALPIRVRRIELYGPESAPGERFDCTAWIRHTGRHEVRADLDVVANGRLRARILGWEDWRFFTGHGVFEVMLQPGTKLFAETEPAGFTIARDHGFASGTVDFLARRFLASKEVAAGGGVAAILKRRDWLFGRIAAKDAVRAHLFARGTPSLFPVEIVVESQGSGRPLVRGPWSQDLRISIAHKDGVGVAIVAEGRDPGIDIEKIEARGEGFAQLAFTAEELARLPARDADEWRTRLWAAKEAAGKAAGSGMGGDPRKIAMSERDGDRMRIGDRWIATRRDGGYVIAWTT